MNHSETFIPTSPVFLSLAYTEFTSLATSIECLLWVFAQFELIVFIVTVESQVLKLFEQMVQNRNSK